jgi:hypothetical protein
MPIDICDMIRVGREPGVYEMLRASYQLMKNVTGAAEIN